MKRRSFLALPRPIVTCILHENTVAENIATIRNGEYKGASSFAIYIDGFSKEELTDESFRKIVDCTPCPIMFLRYRTGDSMTDQDRVDLLTRAVTCGAAAVDFTGDTFDPSPREFTTNPKAIEQQMRAIDRVHELGGEVVMSSHMAEPRTCEQVVEHLKSFEARGVDFAKIVTTADTEEEFLEAMKTHMTLRREMKIPFIFLCNGKFAQITRYFGPALGNGLTFAVERYTPTFTTAQPILENMLKVLNNYHWNINDVL